MTLQFRNDLIHKYVLKAALPLVLHDRFIVHGRPSDEAIACLSFDCENSDDMTMVPSLLDVLKDNKMTSSFAIRGDLVMVHRETIREILTRGHEVVNHTFSHPTGFALVDADTMRREVASFQSLMKSEFRYTPEGFRAPHLMRRYRSELFEILRGNNLYDSSYVGTGITRVDDVIEIPLTDVLTILKYALTTGIISKCLC